MKNIFILVVLLTASLVYARDLPSFEQTELNCENIAYANMLAYWQKKGLIKQGDYPAQLAKRKEQFKSHKEVEYINSLLANKNDVYVQTICDYNVSIDKHLKTLVEWLKKDDNALIELGLSTKTNKGKIDGHGVAVESITENGKIYDIMVCSWGKKFLIHVPVGASWANDGHRFHGTLAPGYGTASNRDAITTIGNTVEITDIQVGLITKKAIIDSNVKTALSYMKKGEFLNYSKLHPYFRLDTYHAIGQAALRSNPDLGEEFWVVVKQWVALKKAGQLKAPSDIEGETVPGNESSDISAVKEKEKKPMKEKTYSTMTYTDPKTGLTITRKIENK